MKKPLGNIHDWGLMFPSKYLSAPDLLGKEVTVEIEEIFADEVIGKDGKKDQKWHIQFKGKKKLYLPNKTASRVICKLYGKDPHNSVGKSVTLYSAPMFCFGEERDVIRIKEEVPSRKAE